MKESEIIEEILDLISIFRSDMNNPTQLWNEVKENIEDDFKEIRHDEFKVVDEEETLEELGVIDVEDELLEGCDDENNQYPVIKNAYARRKGQQKNNNKNSEDAAWSRPLRPHNSSLRPCTPPAKDKGRRPPSRHDYREESKEKFLNIDEKIILPSNTEQKPEVPEFDIEDEGAKKIAEQKKWISSNVEDKWREEWWQVTTRFSHFNVRDTL